MEETPKRACALVLSSNYAYRNHVLAVFAGARNRGAWQEDFALIVDSTWPVHEVESLVSRGVHVLRLPKQPHPAILKLYMSHPFFSIWNRILYLDTDTMVLRDLSPLLKLEGPAFCVPQRYSAREHYDRTDNRLYERICGLLPAREPGFNSGIILMTRKVFFASHTMPWLLYLQKEFRKINSHGGFHGHGEQPTLNVLMCGLWQPFPKDEVHFYGKLREKTIVMHFFRWDAPWENDKPCSLFNKSYRQIYEEDLKNFDQLFPVAEGPGFTDDMTFGGFLRKVIRKLASYLPH
jgi:hypothetical protein